MRSGPAGTIGPATRRTAAIHVVHLVVRRSTGFLRRSGGPADPLRSTEATRFGSVTATGIGSTVATRLEGTGIIRVGIGAVVRLRSGAVARLARPWSGDQPRPFPAQPRFCPAGAPVGPVRTGAPAGTGDQFHGRRSVALIAWVQFSVQVDAFRRIPGPHTAGTVHRLHRTGRSGPVSRISGIHVGPAGDPLDRSRRQSGTGPADPAETAGRAQRRQRLMITKQPTRLALGTAVLSVMRHPSLLTLAAEWAVAPGGEWRPRPWPVGQNVASASSGPCHRTGPR